MNNDNKLIKRIYFTIYKNKFDKNILRVTINRTCLDDFVVLNKVRTVNDINIYFGECNVFWDCSIAVIRLCDAFFCNLLKGGGKINILSDDINYNYINDICKNICNPKKYELSYSVRNKFYLKSAVTLFVNPLKHLELISLVLFEFLKINDYPQDIKNIILMFYSDIYV